MEYYIPTEVQLKSKSYTQENMQMKIQILYKPKLHRRVLASLNSSHTWYNMLNNFATTTELVDTVH